MMKYKKMVLTFLIMFLLMGCDNSTTGELEKNLSKDIDVADTEDAKLVCRMDFDRREDGYVIGSKYYVFADSKDNVKKVISREVYNSYEKDILDSFEQAADEENTAASQYGGYEYNISRKDNKLTVDVTIDYAAFDLDKFITDNATDGSSSIDTSLTLSNFESRYITLGAVCEKK